ncbi:MAG: hypothetical protein L0Y44_06855 [Phycisphaerales bacterium]|nr:hypothetical protein [Phycisphaerales bacterium]
MNRMRNVEMSGAAGAALWASAFVIAALILVQAGRLPENAAHADVVADRGSYTLLTCNSGRGGEVDPEDLLYVIDSREQVLLIYEVEDSRKNQIILRDGGSLDTLFTRAR